MFKLKFGAQRKLCRKSTHIPYKHKIDDDGN